MQKINNLLQQKIKINPAKEEKRIVAFIKKEMKSLGRQGAIIGLSGGLDSSVCAYLLKEALGRKKILALILPEKDSKPQNIKDAEEIASKLKLKTIKIDITPILEEIGVYKLSSKIKTDAKNIERLVKVLSKILGKPSLFAAGLASIYSANESLPAKLKKKVFTPYFSGFNAFVCAKMRVRMILLHFYAALENYFVAGTTDKSEGTIGYFDHYGDGAHDVALLRHLYKTQIRQLANHLGLPEKIALKPPSGDFLAGLPNELFIGISYEILDQILLGLELKETPQTINKLTSASLELIRELQKTIKAAKIRMSLPHHL